MERSALHEAVAEEESLQFDAALYCCIAFILNHDGMFWLVYVMSSSGLSYEDIYVYVYIKQISYFVHTVCVCLFVCLCERLRLQTCIGLWQTLMYKVVLLLISCL
jgi:hypothetical protein